MSSRTNRSSSQHKLKRSGHKQKTTTDAFGSMNATKQSQNVRKSSGHKSAKSLGQGWSSPKSSEVAKNGTHRLNSNGNIQYAATTVSGGDGRGVGRHGCPAVEAEKYQYGAEVSRRPRRGFFGRLFDGMFAPRRERRRRQLLCPTAAASTIVLVKAETPEDEIVSDNEYSVSSSRRSSVSLSPSEIANREEQMEEETNRVAVIDAIPIALSAFFWSRAMVEHNLFLKLGLAPKELKIRAYDLHLRWADFWENRFHRKMKAAGMHAAIEKVFLTEAELEVLGELTERDYTAIEKLLDEQRDFEIHLLNLFGTGEWIGLIHPTFVAHIARETKLFKAIISGLPLTVNEFINLANHDAMEDAGLTGQLLDPRPSNFADIDKAREMQKYFMQLFPKQELADDQKTYIGLSIVGKEELDLYASLQGLRDLIQMDQETKEKIDSGKEAKHTRVFSVIHPLLIAHNLREHAYFAGVLSRIQIAREQRNQEE